MPAPGPQQVFALAGPAQDAAKAVPRLVNPSERHHPGGLRASGGFGLMIQDTGIPCYLHFASLRARSGSTGAAATTAHRATNLICLANWSSSPSAERQEATSPFKSSRRYCSVAMHLCNMRCKPRRPTQGICRALAGILEAGTKHRHPWGSPQRAVQQTTWPRASRSLAGGIRASIFLQPLSGAHLSLVEAFGT